MSLEKLAEEWVQKCVFDHPDLTKYPAYDMFGQNLAARFGTRRVSYAGMAEGWKEEMKDYTLADNSCKAMCGHYTQVTFSTVIYLCAQRVHSSINYLGF